MKTQRAKMSVYMNSLKISKNYTSLKTQYLESQVRKFPAMRGGIAPVMNDMDSAVWTLSTMITPVPLRSETPKLRFWKSL